MGRERKHHDETCSADHCRILQAGIEITIDEQTDASIASIGKGRGPIQGLLNPFSPFAPL